MSCSYRLWFFGGLLITLRRFWANFAGNVIAFLAVIPLTFWRVNTWGMNGVSFAGAGACAIGVLVLLVVALVRELRLVPIPSLVNADDALIAEEAKEE